MAGLDDILASLPIDQIASKLGVDKTTAANAVKEGGGAILSGLQQNAATPDGSAAIEKALEKHSGGAQASSVDDVDEVDGSKILGHIFGDKKDDVVKGLNEEPQTSGIDFGKLLPVLAPIVMGLVAKNRSTGSTESTDAQGGGIGDVIGGLLGGGSSSGGGFDIGGIISNLFGGKR